MLKPLESIVINKVSRLLEREGKILAYSLEQPSFEKSFNQFINLKEVK